MKIFISILQCICKWCSAMHDFTSLNMQMVQCKCMTSLLPTNPKEGNEGCNHIAISQCALLYRYLPHQSGYGFFICIFNMRVQKHDCNAWTSYTSRIYSSKSNATSKQIYNLEKKKIQNYSGQCELLKFNGGNSNNKGKASRPHRYVYLPLPKIKNVS